MNPGLARPAHADHMSQVRQAVLDRPEIGERRRLDDGDAGLRMIEPVFQGLRAEQMRKRQRDRPHLEDRHVGDRGLGALRQDEGHALAAPDAESRQRVRQAVRRRLDVPERVGGGGARLVLPIEREARAVFRPLPAARARDVVALRDVPTEALIELVVAIDHGPKQFNIGKMPIGALVFDAYGTLFDVHSVVRRCEGLWPGKGAQLSQLWRAKQLEYTWQRSLMKRYAPFSTVTRAALAYGCEALGLELTAERMEALMGEYLMLSLYPDVPHAIEQFAGKKAILTNGSPDMIAPLVAHSGLKFDAVLSVDKLKIYKPAPEVYGLAVKELTIPKEKIGFVSSNCWDALGAKAVGFTVYWINRLGAPVERLGFTPDTTIKSFLDLACNSATAVGCWTWASGPVKRRSRWPSSPNSGFPGRKSPFAPAAHPCGTGSPIARKGFSASTARTSRCTGGLTTDDTMRGIERRA